MPECHTCPYQKDVQAGKYADIPFDETPCSGCKLREDSSSTMEFKQWRADNTGEHKFVVGHHRPVHRSIQTADGGHESDERPDLADNMPVDVLREVVAALLAMPPEFRDAVCWRFSGFKYSEIAAVQGTTIAAAEQRHRKALKRVPVLNALFPLKAVKQKVRKPHG